MARLRLKAKRSGLWFRALRRIDRALVDLTIFVADGVRSAVLARSLSSVVKKLEELAESRLQRVTREVGVFLARKRALLAQKWGNLSAACVGSRFVFRPVSGGHEAE